MKNEKLKISILMPVYNAGDFLDDCIDSILLQSEDNWELICINDFSSDLSHELLDFYSEMDPRIKVFHNKSKGIIPALQYAFTQSTGQLITRMDADDLMHDRKLEMLKETLLSHGKGHCITTMVEYFPKENIRNGYKRYADWLNDLGVFNSHYQEIYKECVLPSPSWMMFKTDITEFGGITGGHYPEDYDLVFRMYKHKIKIVCVPKVLHYWRDHELRASRTNPHYSDQSFLSLKIPYFLELDRDKDRPLAIWGAGKKGKKLARMLRDLGEKFTWLTDNKKKWNHHILETKVEDPDELKNLKDYQLLISISSPKEVLQLEERLLSEEWVKNKDYFILY